MNNECSIKITPNFRKQDLFTVRDNRYVETVSYNLILAHVGDKEVYRWEFPDKDLFRAISEAGKQIKHFAL